jgi:hypothetical protein
MKKIKNPKGVAEAWYVTQVGAFTSKQTNMGITTGSDFFFVVKFRNQTN